MNKSFLVVLTRLCTCAIMLSLCAFLMSSCVPASKEDIWTKTGEGTSVEIINDVEWTLHFNNFINQNQNKHKNELAYITTSYSENEQSSSYYEKLRKKHGDSSIYITHDFDMLGTPLGENWYSIEMTETIKCGWGCDGILSTKTVRHDEKILFTSLS